MNLEEFVAQSLSQIVKGIKQANRDISGKETPGAEDKAFLLQYSGGDQPKSPHVEFDVAVTTRAESKASGGAKAELYVAGFEAGAAKLASTENVSRIRFSVLVKEHQG